MTLQIPQRYIEYIELRSISPLPHANRTVNGVTTYYFHASQTANIHCQIMAKKTGNITATFKINETPFTIAHQIYP
jgi:hypothetical protein